MEKNEELFKKIWSNIIINNEIMLHLKHDKKIFHDYQSLLKFKLKEYVSVLKISLNYRVKLEKKLNLFELGYINLKHLIINNYNNNISLKGIKKIEFKDYFSFKDNILDGVEELIIYDKVYKNIEIQDLPKSLKILKLLKFNSNISIDKSLNYNLKHLELGEYYDQPLLTTGHLSNISESSIEYLSMGNNFNQSIIPNSLPSTLKILDLGKRFNHQLEPGSIPNGVEKLYLGRYNHTLKPNIIPNSVTYLDFGANFNSEIEIGSIPESVKTIILRCSYKQIPPKGTIPSTVKNLYLPHYCNSLPYFTTMYNTKSLESLYFGKKNNWIKEF